MFGWVSQRYIFLGLMMGNHRNNLITVAIHVTEWYIIHTCTYLCNEKSGTYCFAHAKQWTHLTEFVSYGLWYMNMKLKKKKPYFKKPKPFFVCFSSNITQTYFKGWFIDTPSNLSVLIKKKKTALKISMNINNSYNIWNYYKKHARYYSTIYHNAKMKKQQVT